MGTGRQNGTSGALKRDEFRLRQERRSITSPSPRSSRGEGWGEGLPPQIPSIDACRASPSPGLRCNPTSPRKRGEVKWDSCADSTQPHHALMPDKGHSRPGRAPGESGHVGYASKAELNSGHWRFRCDRLAFGPDHGSALVWFFSVLAPRLREDFHRGAKMRLFPHLFIQLYEPAIPGCV